MKMTIDKLIKKLEALKKKSGGDARVVSFPYRTHPGSKFSFSFCPRVAIMDSKELIEISSEKENEEGTERIVII